MRSVLPGWPWKKNAANAKTEAGQPASDPSVERLLAANDHIRELLEDTSTPASVRAELSAEFDEIQAISEKLSREEIHIAVFGRVGVGKSSLLNALLGQEVFSTSPLHGETRIEGRSDWTREGRQDHVVLIDTPGIDEMDGEQREALANSVARRSDIVIMVCEGDLVESEFTALSLLLKEKRAVVLALNKADHFTVDERQLVMNRLRERTERLLPSTHIVAVSADPRPPGHPHGVESLKALLWDILERKGKSLSALNASLFAADLDQKIASRIVEARREVAQRIIRNYCITKGLVVAANPIPVADLLAAAGTDVAMVMHLGEVYGFRLNRRESARLLVTISAQMVALMGAYWGTNLASSLLKTASAGFSTTLTAAAQGALAWYATLVTGRMAETWFARGKSWGSSGPREAAQEIIAEFDRDRVLAQARDELASKLDEK